MSKIQKIVSIRTLVVFSDLGVKKDILVVTGFPGFLLLLQQLYLFGTGTGLAVKHVKDKNIYYSS